MLRNVRFLNAGYCIQNEFLTGVDTFRWRRFYAVCMTFDHPVHGRCMIDSGYGPRFLDATARLPHRLMRYIVYTPTRQAVFGDSFLSSVNIDPAKISHLFISHYHADHIGGLSRFPFSRLVARLKPLKWLQGLSRIKQLHNGFLEDLLPTDFHARCEAVDEDRFSPHSPYHPEIPAIDYWGDGSLILLDLPGHAIGQTGYILTTDRGTICYAVDAFWDVRAFEAEKRLPLLARRVQHSMKDYDTSLRRLRELHAETGIPVLGCHCKKTQAYAEHSY